MNFTLNFFKLFLQSVQSIAENDPTAYNITVYGKIVSLFPFIDVDERDVFCHCVCQ